MSNSIGKQAVVIGAGIAGLVAARVLADYFDKVLVLERDMLPGVPDHRPGTPQSRHTHTLLSGGMQALRGLFPELERQLVESGSIILDVGLDLRSERPDYNPFPQRKTDVVSYSASRPLIVLANSPGWDQPASWFLVCCWVCDRATVRCFCLAIWVMTSSR